jgi:S1-C subfamily serine protease|uniref:Periplasmic serine protease n=1 Tax=Podoviridae sp. ct9P15 TaxID=2826543 RepID=A0A8S5MFA3_9CAUD|nr:MAG TPA: periplasmic serine protease [Podoviridae sp. ct9P15]
MKYLAIALAAAALLSGCSWTGEISRDFYVPDTRPANEKQNAVVGLMAQKAPKQVRYGQSVDYRLSIKNYIYALQSELQQHFKEVRLIKNAKECPQCNLFAASLAGVSINQNEESYKAYLQCDFYLPNGRMLTRVGSVSEGDASPSASLSRKTTINGMMLGAIAASTISDYGEMITEVSENAISEVVSDVGAKIRVDPFLRATPVIVAGVPSDSMTVSARSKPVQQSRLAHSKYQKYINATLVIVTPGGHGSAFAINQNGTLLTNAHVVDDWGIVKVLYADGTAVDGIVKRVDKNRDLAIVKINKPTLEYLKLGSERDFAIGDKVIAVGAPKEFQNTVTAGIVSQSRIHNQTRYIQTDADINPGNSGGALICERTGTVVGVNTWGRRGTTGLNFAVAVDEVKDFLAGK